MPSSTGDEGSLVVCAGAIDVHIVGALPRIPTHGGAAPLSRVSVQPGGAAATAAAAARAFGAHVRLCGALPDDFLGHFVRDGLAAVGIDMEFVAVGSGCLSPFRFTIVASEDQRATTFFTEGDVGAPVAAVTGDVIDGADALVIDASEPARWCELAAAARARDVDVIVRAHRVSEGIGELVSMATALVCSERVASELAPRGELQDSLYELQDLGPGRVAVTLGDAGVIALAGDQLVTQAVYPVSVVDTTGAGFVFTGTFAAASAEGAPFPRCIALASAAAALSCRQLGGLAGIADRADVEALVAS